ncbi:hypothetical protein SO802_006016 [Lithocarpus litseifolius]|uniref:Uncharacterized protein n=1 Tax=Lithocarpus litseifolius TaxID=425828 RepID=A0AAW2DJT1_9ROSI
MISEDSLATCLEALHFQRRYGGKHCKLDSKLPNSAGAGGALDGFGSYADNDDDGVGINCREEKEVAHGIGEMQ